mmetsp:Transcript_108299/g.209662  ORF Transcript_108299/g.209662 Transcript_108299/m.209662 type:complete len:80 (-) Transcript_108299:409-648(-)
MWTKDTAPPKKAMIAPTCNTRLPRAAGNNAIISLRVSFGTFRTPSTHKGPKMNQPNEICHSAWVQGKGNAINAFLKSML